jgi:leucyl aminopeptidase
MPLNKKLKSQLKSPIADLKNTGERWGGAITAGLFLEHFIKDTAWVHVDLAGPASVNRESGSTMRGGTGFAVATIVEHATR